MPLGRLALAIVTAVALAGSANAYCSKPSFSDSPPEPPPLHYRPNVPYCLSSYSYSNKHTCEQWELDSYQIEVSDYVDRLRRYLNEVAEYAQQANNYADDAGRYAKCEAEEVSSQHQ